MSTTLTLRDLGNWANAQKGRRVLDMPAGEVMAQLGRVMGTHSMLVHLVQEHECSTLRDVLMHPSADACLRAQMSPLSRSAFVSIVRDWLSAGLEQHDDVPPAPAEGPTLRRWIAEHGVLDRLADPVTVLASRVSPYLRYQLDHLQVGDRKATLDDLLRASEAPGGKVVRMASRDQSDLVRAARAYLLDVARASAAWATTRRALEERAVPPTEPGLRALAERLDAARTELGQGVVRRQVGMYMPEPVKLNDDPFRFSYREADQHSGPATFVRVEITVDADPLAPSCSCTKAGCDHVLAALDGALDLLRDPQRQPDQQKLAKHLATPAWARFLDAVGDGITPAASAGQAGPRLAFRIHESGASIVVEVLLQKPLKRSGWSVGQRIEPSDVKRRAGLSLDPHDTRVLAAMLEGLEESGGAMYGGPSRARVARTLLALAGHPLAFLAERPGVAVRIERARLRLLLEPCHDGVTAALAVGERRLRPAEIGAAAAGSEHVILVDVTGPSIAVCTLDARAQVLVVALEKFPARFPPESYDELIRRLTPMQESVALELPDMLQGAPVDADRRPVVRLSPLPSGPETEVAIFVRPLPGAPIFRPGEGSAVVLHTLGGRRVAAHRALAEEPAAVMAVVQGLPLPDMMPGATEPPSDWTWRLPSQESVLDLLGALRDLGDGVVVEWPEPNRRMELGNAALRRSLKLRITDKRDWFGVEGEVMIDDQAVSFAALLEAVRGGQRYVQVGPNRFAAIEEDLRRQLTTAADLVFKGRHGLEVGLPAAGALAELVDDPSQLEAVVRWRGLVQRIDAARALDPQVPAGLVATLRHYQVEGFQWLSRLAAWGIGGCLADDMGLGKTVQALALLLERAPLGPALVLAPTSVGPNWVSEAARFAPGLRVQLYRGGGRGAMLAGLGAGDLMVTSYGLATRDAEALAGVHFATLIIDEAQAIKNALTRRARAVRDLDADFRVALTGTPVENHLGELWSLMRIVAPGLFGSWDQFRDRFATPIERGRDPDRRAALARALRPFLLRRAKSEVAPELPPRTEIARIVDPSPAERKLYDEARRAALAAIASGEGDARFILLAALTRLRRLACHPRLHDAASPVPSSKLAALLEIVRELRETGHRALVFSQFTSHLALVREALDAEGITYAYLDGSTPSEERTRRIAVFQAGGPDLFLISLKAGGTGLNLTAADYVIHLDPWWNPAVEDQATDRAHRIGQDKAVTVIRLIMRGTIEETVLSMHGDKRALAAGVFDEEGGPARLSATDLAELIRAGVDTGSGADPLEDDAGDVLGAEIMAEDMAEPPSRPPRPPAVVVVSVAPVSAAPVSAAPVSAAPVSTAPVDVTAEPGPAPPADGPDLAEFAERVLDNLAARKQIADRRYDATLRSYARSLRRFTDYVAAESKAEAFQARPDEVMDGYLDALHAGHWSAPQSEPGVARVVLNHVRAFLREQARG